MALDDESFAEAEREILEYKPINSDLGPVHLGHLGQKISNMISGQNDRVRPLLSVLSIPIVVIGLVALFVYVGLWFNIPRAVLVDGANGTVGLGFLIILCLLVVLPLGLAIFIYPRLREWVSHWLNAQPASLTLWVAAPANSTLSFGYETADFRQLKQILKEGDIPAQLSSIKTSIAEMLETDPAALTDNSLHLMEIQIKESEFRDNLIAGSHQDDKDEQQRISYPINGIAGLLQNFEGTALLQIHCHPREGDERLFDEKTTAVRTKNAKYRWYKRLGLYLEKLNPNSDLASRQLTQEELHGADKLRHDGLSQTDANYTFGVTVRVAVVDDQQTDPAEVESLFENIAGEIDAAVFDKLTVESNISLANHGTNRNRWNSWKRTQLLSRFKNSQYTKRPAGNLVSTDVCHNVADSTSIWQYLLVVPNESADLTREGIERDQTATERPAEEKMDHLRADESAAPWEGEV